ncbi:hypothetical protein BHE74_00037296 [Ensete ventricosum]|nr:hypothetical protein BHE74_00037296 [Ensete ventricosum]RZS25046.1 hypothetical protein BHM03_00058192 [Ensete ventricosum]
MDRRSESAVPIKQREAIREEEKLQITYVDEAVMEEEANDGGAHPGILADDLRHDRPGDALQVGARRGVERRGELTVGGARQQREEGHCEKAIRERSHGWREEEVGVSDKKGFVRVIQLVKHWRQIPGGCDNCASLSYLIVCIGQQWGSAGMLSPSGLLCHFVRFLTGSSC